MSAEIINGKEISDNIRKEMKEEIIQLQQNGINPGLAVIIVGNDSASRIYVENKRKACNKLNIFQETFYMPECISEQRLLEEIDNLNKRNDIHGILIQLPLPDHINSKKILSFINPDKDVDAFHDVNVGKIVHGDYKFLPCTPYGILKLIESTGIIIDGKECVIVGRSDIVGKPMALVMLQNNATVTICHSHTKNLGEITKRADILIVAVGKPNFITKDMVKHGAIVIDVGINRTENGICGDVDFENVKEVASWITPVPGGVGPMTITMLLRNTIDAAKYFNN